MNVPSGAQSADPIAEGCGSMQAGLHTNMPNMNLEQSVNTLKVKIKQEKDYLFHCAVKDEASMDVPSMAQSTDPEAEESGSTKAGLHTVMPNVNLKKGVDLCVVEIKQERDNVFDYAEEELYEASMDVPNVAQSTFPEPEAGGSMKARLHTDMPNVNLEKGMDLTVVEIKQEKDYVFDYAEEELYEGSMDVPRNPRSADPIAVPCGSLNAGLPAGVPNVNLVTSMIQEKQEFNDANSEDTVSSTNLPDSDIDTELSMKIEPIDASEVQVIVETEPREYEDSNSANDVELPYFCDPCNRNYTSRDNPCLHIEKRFNLTNQRDLEPLQTSKEKKKKTKGETLYQCPVCQRQFNMKKNLKRHVKLHTDDKPFQCSLCEKSFHDKSYLKKHLKLHTGEKPYQCSICDIRFNQTWLLKRHQSIHSAVKAFQCNVCEKRFSEPWHLKQHQAIHSNIKAYQCEVCERRFTQKSHLTVHKRIHTGEKPYQCTLCEKRFTETWRLNQHQAMHSAVKAHQCDVCEKRFTHKGNLTVHKRKHTGELPFQCSECDRRFINKSYLKYHLKKHAS